MICTLPLTDRRTKTIGSGANPPRQPNMLVSNFGVQSLQNALVSDTCMNLKHIHRISYICFQKFHVSSACHNMSSNFSHCQASKTSSTICRRSEVVTVSMSGLPGWFMSHRAATARIPPNCQWLPRFQTTQPPTGKLAGSLIAVAQIWLPSPPWCHAMMPCQEPLIALEVSDEDQRQSKVTWKTLENPPFIPSGNLSK